MEKEKSITVAHISDYLPEMHSMWGGAEQAALRLFLFIQKRSSLIFQIFLTLPVQKKSKFVKLYQVPLTENYIPFAKKVIFLFKLLFPVDLAVFLKSYVIFKKEKVQIVHLHKFDMLSFAPLLSACLLKTPTVFSLYDLWAICPRRILIDGRNIPCNRYHGKWCIPCMNETNFFKRLSLKCRRPLFNYFFCKIDRFAVLSETVKKQLINAGIPQEKITILPLPFSFENTDITELPFDQHSILFVGWVNVHKGLGVLIDALIMIKKEIPEIKLYVVETGEDANYKNEIIRKVNAEFLQTNVIFLGKRKNEEVRKYLKTCNVVVVPEQWGIAWPIFLTEAMYFKKSIVASKIGDIPFFIKNKQNGFLSKHDDPQDFAQKILYLLNNPQEAKKMSEQAHNDILKIVDEEKFYKNLTRIYLELLNFKENEK